MRTSCPPTRRPSRRRGPDAHGPTSDVGTERCQAELTARRCLRAVDRSGRHHARVAGLAAVVSAGAAAVSLARGGRRAPVADSGLVGLIERVADATSTARTVDSALSACVEQLCRWTGWPVGHVYFVDPAQEGRAGPSELWSVSDPARFAAFRAETERMEMPRGVGLPGRVLESGRAEWIVDVTCAPNFPRSACAASVGLRGGFSFPVGTAEETVAIIECFSLDAVTPDDRLLEVASHIGRQLGRLIAGLHTEEALRESESRFRSVAEAANDAIIAADRAGLILSWNPAAERMFGYSAERILGKPLSLLMPERFRPMHDAGVRRVAERPETSRIIGQTSRSSGSARTGRSSRSSSRSPPGRRAARGSSAASSATSPRASRPRTARASWRPRRTRSSRSTPPA